LLAQKGKKFSQLRLAAFRMRPIDKSGWRARQGRGRTYKKLKKPSSLGKIKGGYRVDTLSAAAFGKE